MCHQAVPNFVLYKNNSKAPWDTHEEQQATCTVGLGMLETVLHTHLTCALWFLAKTVPTTLAAVPCHKLMASLEGHILGTALGAKGVCTPKKQTSVFSRKGHGPCDLSTWNFLGNLEKLQSSETA